MVKISRGLVGVRWVLSSVVFSLYIYEKSDYVSLINNVKALYRKVKTIDFFPDIFLHLLASVPIVKSLMKKCYLFLPRNVTVAPEMLSNMDTSPKKNFGYSL